MIEDLLLVVALHLVDELPAVPAAETVHSPAGHRTVNLPPGRPPATKVDRVVGIAALVVKGDNCKKNLLISESSLIPVSVTDAHKKTSM